MLCIPFGPGGWTGWTADIILLSECVFFFKEISAALILHFLAYYVLCLVKLMIDDLT